VSQDTDCHKFTNNAPAAATKALIALGSNISSHAGPPALTIKAALSSLGDSLLQVEKCSALYATPCFPAGAGPDYINAAAVLSGPSDPHDILAILHGVEARFDRARVTRWGQRTLDLDLIAVGNRVLPDPETFDRWRDLPAERQMTDTPDRLIVPHPRLHERAFVLVPLAEIAPDWTHPVLGLTPLEMIEYLDPRDVAQIRVADS